MVTEAEEEGREQERTKASQMFGVTSAITRPSSAFSYLLLTVGLAVFCQNEKTSITGQTRSFR